MCSLHPIAAIQHGVIDVETCSGAYMKPTTIAVDVSEIIYDSFVYFELVINCLDTQGHPFEMSEKYNVIAIKLMNISVCNFL